MQVPETSVSAETNLRVLRLAWMFEQPGELLCNAAQALVIDCIGLVTLSFAG